MNEKSARQKFSVYSREGCYHHYDFSTSDQSSGSESNSESSDSEINSEVGYGSGHSENSLFSSDEDALLRHNLYRRRNFTKRAKRKISVKDIDFDSTGDRTHTRPSAQSIDTKKHSPVFDKCHLLPTNKSKQAIKNNINLDNVPICEKVSLVVGIQPLTKDKDPSTHSTGAKANRLSWHYPNSANVNRSINLNCYINGLQKRRSWTDSGVSLSKTDSAGSSLGSRSYRSISKDSEPSWYVCPETNMVHQNYNFDDETSTCTPTQTNKPCDESDGNCTAVEDSEMNIFNIKEKGSSETPSNRRRKTLRHLSEPSETISLEKKKVNISSDTYCYTASDTIENCFEKMCNYSVKETPAVGMKETNRNNRQCEISRNVSNGSERYLHTPIQEERTQPSIPGPVEDDVFRHFKLHPHPSERNSKYDSPLLTATGELIALVNSKRFSGRRMSFDDTHYTPKEKEILEQLFKNAEVSVHDDVNQGKAHIKLANQRSQIPLPDHLNYPMCMYYSGSTGKENKSRSFLKSLKKFKETIKFRKILKSSPTTLVQEELEHKEPLDVFCVNPKRGQGTASKGRRLIKRMLTRSSGKSIKLQQDPVPGRHDTSIGFRRNRSGSTRSVPDSIRNLWGRASVENIKGAFDRTFGRSSARLSRTNSTHSLFGRKRSGSTDQISHFGHDKKSVLGGKRSESMRSLSAVGGFDIAVGLLTAATHRQCRTSDKQTVNSDFNGHFTQCEMVNLRSCRRQSVISRESIPNFCGLQGRLMQGGCHDKECTADGCYRYSCYCEDYCDYDSCSLCDDPDCCELNNDFLYPDDDFVLAQNVSAGSSTATSHIVPCGHTCDVVVPPLNMTVTQERVAERRVLTKQNREKLDTFV